MLVYVRPPCIFSWFYWHCTFLAIADAFRICDPAIATPNPAQLISVHGLSSRLRKNTPLLVIEVASPEELRQHPLRIPGSRLLWRPDFEAPVDPVRQPLAGLLPTQKQFAALARRLGVDDGTDIVILDHKYDATRLWWLFILFGKDPGTVSVLDGGYRAALECGLASERVPSSASASTSSCITAPAGAEGRWKLTNLNGRLMSSMEEVQALQYTDTSNRTSRLWDVRTVAEFEGSITMPGACRPGRIPWTSGRLDWDLFRNRAIGAATTWKTSAEIRRLAEEQLQISWEESKNASNAKEQQHTFYCQSGVRTTQLIFGLALAGYSLERLKNYDGSWVEWSFFQENECI